MRGFEFFVALRYLVAPRKQAGVSVITVFSVLAVALGVIAIIIAMAITNGFRNTLQTKLLSATPHVTVMEKEPSTGIENWRELRAKFSTLPGVAGASPALYGIVMFTGPLQAAGGNLKGIMGPGDAPLPDALVHLKTGSIKDWRGTPSVLLCEPIARITSGSQPCSSRSFMPQAGCSSGCCS